MSAGEPIQVENSLPSELKVFQEIGFHKRPTTACSDGLSPSLVKSNDQVAVSELTKLLGLTRTSEEIPDDQFEPVTVATLIWKSKDLA